MIDRAMQWTLPAGEAIDLHYRRTTADGSVRELLGEVYSLAIYSSDRELLAGAASVIERDIEGDYAALRIPATEAAALLGQIGLRWELSELLPGGARQQRAGGSFVIETSAATLVGTAPITGAGDAEELTDRDESE